jgi:hypothetical protein
MALPPPFVSSGSSQSFVPAPAFDSTLQLLTKDPTLGLLDILVVDLTSQPKGGIGFGSFGILNGARPRYAASTVKIAAMFAAYRLRKSLIDAGSGADANTPDEFVAEVEREWKPIVAKTMPGQDDFPKLKTIFDISGSNKSWTIEFTAKYSAHMVGMVRWSHNEDASACILPLGYKFIQGALLAEGFYTLGGGGIWLTGDYSSGRDGPADRFSGSHQAAHVSAYAKFITALANDTLVDAKASDEMRKIAKGFWMKDILKENNKSVSPNSFGKLGIGNDQTYHDVAVVERTTGRGNLIRYAVVILGSQTATPLWTVGEFVDEMVAIAHGG